MDLRVRGEGKGNQRGTVSKILPKRLFEVRMETGDVVSRDLRRARKAGQLHNRHRAAGLHADFRQEPSTRSDHRARVAAL